MFSQDANFPDITLALAAVCQAIDCVQSIARNGQANKDDMDTLLRATLKLDAKSPEEIYGSYKDLHTGFKAIVAQLSGNKTDADFGRYLVNILSLEKQFISHQKMVGLMTAKINQANRLFNYQDNDDVTSDLVQQLATAYKETISTLSTKIQVTGNSKYLEQSTNQNLIRALLLSAIRSAVLWRQLGGKKRQFIFNKNKIVETAKAFID
ncbi:MAG: high frequency lysogenization protein HflD [Gammaproteobacteria bacterium]|nr:high frequency lysogenization protein HflD [Gammaproteobacteria bacterium]